MSPAAERTEQGVALPRLDNNWIILGRRSWVALAWPFFGSRGVVNIATLILIYVMLGQPERTWLVRWTARSPGYVGFCAVGACGAAVALLRPGLLGMPG
jgi:hypothetical protein